MKRIGLIGGISWLGTASYYAAVNSGVNRRLGGAAAADLLIRSLNFADGLANAGTPEVVSSMMTDAAAALVEGGAEIVAVASSTGNIFLGGLSDGVDHFLLL